MNYALDSPPDNDLAKHSFEGFDVQIGVNLECALRHLRQGRDSKLILWADAICIDQQNLKERSNQVQRMGSIYSKAGEALLWLGPRG